MIVSKLLNVLGAASILVLSAGGMALAVGDFHWGSDPDRPERPAHWGYNPHRHDGPDHWGKLKKSDGNLAIPDCNGRMQSPININATVDGANVSISFNLKATSLNVLNNGHTIQVDYKNGSTTMIDGVEWPLTALHFHTSSEHEFKGELMLAEAHLVHIKTDGNVAVVGVLFKAGAANPVLQGMLEVLAAGRTGPHYERGLFLDPDERTVNPTDLLPEGYGLYTYSGSLTAPPCTEGVNWNVMRETMTVSREQVEWFREILDDVGHFRINNRPVQPLNGRVVTERLAD